MNTGRSRGQIDLNSSLLTPPPPPQRRKMLQAADDNLVALTVISETNRKEPAVNMAASYTHSAATNKAVLDRYMRLPQPDDKIMATYVWIDGTGEYCRAKTRTIDFIPKDPSGNWRKFYYLCLAGVAITLLVQHINSKHCSSIINYGLHYHSPSYRFCGEVSIVWSISASKTT